MQELPQSRDIFLRCFLFFNCSPNRDHPVQGVRGQVERCALRRDHVRGVQGFLPAQPELRGELPVPAPEELRRRQGQQEPVPVLPTAEVPLPRHVTRR